MSVPDTLLLFYCWLILCFVSLCFPSVTIQDRRIRIFSFSICRSRLLTMANRRRKPQPEWGWRCSLSRPPHWTLPNFPSLTTRFRLWRTARSGRCWTCTKLRTLTGTNSLTLWQVQKGFYASRALALSNVSD